MRKLISTFRDPAVRLLPLAKTLEDCLENVKRVVLLGSTGDGKSSLANSLLGLKSNEGFKESSKAESCTSVTKELTGAWRGTGPLCTIIDTPGMNDSQGRDMDHMDHIMETLKKGKSINTFLVTRNGNNLRMDGPFKNMFKIFEMIFGESFWSQVVVSVSKTRYVEEETGTVQESIKEWEDAIKNEFPKAKLASLPSVVLDTGKQGDPKFSKGADDLWHLCSSMASFECKDFQTVQQETSSLLAQQKEESDRLLENMRLELLKKEEELSRIRSRPEQISTRKEVIDISESRLDPHKTTRRIRQRNRSSKRSLAQNPIRQTEKSCPVKVITTQSQRRILSAQKHPRFLKR